MSKVQKIAFGKIINNKKSEQEEMNEWWWSVGKRCLLKEGDSTLFGILSDISLMERCLPGLWEGQISKCHILVACQM